MIYLCLQNASSPRSSGSSRNNSGASTPKGKGQNKGVFMDEAAVDNAMAAAAAASGSDDSGSQKGDFSSKKKSELPVICQYIVLLY